MKKTACRGFNKRFKIWAINCDFFNRVERKNINSPRMNKNSIYEMWIGGQLDAAIALGVVKTSVIIYCKIYHEYVKERTVGNNYSTAVMITAERLHTTESTVKRAISAVI